MHRTNIYLTEEQERALDALARAEGTTRSEAIRNILDKHLIIGKDDGAYVALVEVIEEVDRALDDLFVDDEDLAIH